MRTKFSLLNFVHPIRMFTGKFRQHHHFFCKWCEMLTAIFVGFETHFIGLAIVCLVWVVLDGVEIYNGWIE